MAQAIWEDDWLRLRAAVPVAPAFGALAMVALLRYADVVQWGRPAAWALVALLASLIASGLYAVRAAGKARSA
jgi:hypothetical protein